VTFENTAEWVQIKSGTIPEPGAMSLLALGAVMTFLRRGRRSVRHQSAQTSL